MNNLAARFETKFLRKEFASCWPWIAVKNAQGYGEIKASGRNKKYKAHRIAYELAKGPIPPGLVIDHICRNPSCVNPEHLRVVTKVENTMIGFGYYAVNGRKTHCAKGHEFTPENTTKHSGGGRRCLTCKRFQNQEYKRKKRSNG